MSEDPARSDAAAQELDSHAHEEEARRRSDVERRDHGHELEGAEDQVERGMPTSTGDR